MGWERRRSGKAYYYRAVRVNGQPRKLYTGSGPAAAAVASQVEERRQRREADRLCVLAEQSRLGPADTTLQRADSLIRLLYAASLTLAGYHLHHRSEWRRRQDMGRTTQSDKTDRTGAADDTAKTAPKPRSGKHVKGGTVAVPPVIRPPGPKAKCSRS